VRADARWEWMIVLRFTVRVLEKVMEVGSGRMKYIDIGDGAML
jgi:hypothetical protein